MAPVFARLFKYRADPKTGTYTFGHRSYEPPRDLKNMPYDGFRPIEAHLGNWETARHTDWPEFASYFRQQAGFPHSDQPQPPEHDVLLALTRYGPFLEELTRAAGERPLTRFPVDWYREVVVATPAPHYSALQQIFSTLSLRACAELATDHADDALTDIELSSRLAQGMSAEPMLITELVQSVGVGLTLSPVWEGLADRRWSANQLARLQADLERIDALADAAFMLRGERAVDLKFINYWNAHRRLYSFAMPADGTSPFAIPMNKGLADLLGAVHPGRLVRPEQGRRRARAAGVFPRRHRSENTPRLPDKASAGARALAAVPLRPTTVIAKISVFSPAEILRRPAHTQTNVDEAVTACAVERFFLEHQSYPKRLDELVPAYLRRVPNDIIDGTPLRYQTTPDERYVLYSVGWNARDENGRVARNERGQISQTEGDWVWRYTDPEAPVPSGAAPQTRQDGG